MATRIYSALPDKIHLNNQQLNRTISGCRVNDRGAQKELYQHFYGYAMSIAARYASSYANAIEMINDSFLKVYTEVKNFEPRYDNVAATFTAWFKRIVINACIDHIRKYNKKETMLGGDPGQLVLADEKETAEQMLQHKEIIKCIQQLSPAYKTVFNLYVIEGFSHAEIAQKLNISENTSKSNLHKARQNLKQLLEKSNKIACEGAQY